MAHKKNRGRDTQPPRETELKLECPPDAVGGIPALPVLAEAEPVPEAGGTLTATYFDTPERALREAGLSVRLRRNGERTIQTVKAETGSRGLILDRREWEVAVDGNELDWKAAAKTALKPFLAEGRERIQPAFTVEAERAALAVRRDGALIELVADDVRISAGDGELRFGEVELEVKKGDAKGVFGLALDLADAAPVRLSLLTKSERGYALLSKEPPSPVKAERLALPADATAAEAFQIVARSCLSQTIRNEALIRSTRNPLALHQTRVGLRRLRAAASLFKDLIADEESTRIRAELRWMNHALGPVRDLDVLVARMRAAPEAERERGHAKALAAAERRRTEAYDHVLELLNGARFRKAVIATAAWIEGGRWLTSDAPGLRRIRDERVVDRAVGELARRRKKVLKRAKALAEMDPHARHQVRIEIKKLRYGAEFFGSLFAGDKAKKRRRESLDTLEALQEVLGELNDIAVGGHILAPPPAQDGEVPADAQVQALLGRARDLTRALARTKPFWE
ncbi:MAG TPA: CHAD domain-containing protein [Microvirga sp.]|jgi:inorganic triphosphatase YgiF|nr:CHAD domain-containing protein [Microvirga sp.]